MMYTRREFTRMSLAALPALPVMAATAIEHVNLGVITYSFRSMPDQSAEAMLKYVLQTGLTQVQVLDDMVESFAGIPAAPASRDARTKWRRSAPIDRIKALRKLYNDAGVSIFSVFLLGSGADIVASEDDMVYAFDMAEALGATHLTIELPANGAALKRIGDYALRRKIYAAYHAHLQSRFTAWDEAFAASKGNMSNIDVGHYVAAGAGDPLLFLKKYHARIASFHLKDRATPENGALNLPFGQGQTPIAEILRTVRRERYSMPATIEMEYAIPEGSDAVQEVAKCVDFCRRSLS